jgi:serine/threonine protein kinase
MEVLEGPTLRRWARAEQRTWREVARIGAILARALHAVHARDITHRDIKPDNIVMTADGQPILVDFGLAQTRSADDLAGTLGYMAPEVLAGAPPSPLADQYALAMTLREAALGCDLTVLGTDEEPPVPPRLERVLSVALAEQPERRYRDMEELATALERALGRSRRTLLVGVAGVLFVALAAVVAAIRLTSARAPDCRISETSLDRLWPGRRAQVLERLAAHGLDLGGRAEVLDEFARGWKDARADLCERRPAEGSEHAARYASRMACLESTRAELDTLLTLLAGEDRDLAQHALARVPEMTPPAYCLRPSTVSLATPPPADRPELAAELDRLLATSSLLYSASRLDEARALLGRAHQIAEELDHPPSRGRVHLQ